MKLIVVCFDHNNERLPKEVISNISSKFINENIEFKILKDRNNSNYLNNDLSCCLYEKLLILEIHENILDKEGKEYSIILSSSRIKKIDNIIHKIEETLKKYNLKPSKELYLVDSQGKKDCRKS